MANAAELHARRDALEAQRSSGLARVSYDGKTVDYHSVAGIDRAMEARDREIAAAEGRRIVDMVWEDLTPDKIVIPAAMRNASTVAMTTGCSTNAVIHLVAVARRAGIDWSLDGLDRIGRDVPVIANLRPFVGHT